MTDCPTCETLVEYVLGVSRPGSVAPILRHAAGCESCRTEIYILRRALDSTLGPVGPSTPAGGAS
jgi:hypothetical protein